MSNLIPLTERSQEEAQEIRRKGGRASALKKKREKNMRAAAREFLRMTIRKGKAVDLEKIRVLDDAHKANMTVEELIVFQQIGKAVRGDEKAAVFIRDITGQSPVEINVTTNVDDPFEGLTTEQLIKFIQIAEKNEAEQRVIKNSED